MRSDRPVFRALAFAGLALTLPWPAAATEFKAGDLTIQQPWVRATPAGTRVGGGFVTIVNHGKTPDTLTGGTCEASAKVELHETVVENGAMTMRPTGPLTIAPGASLAFAPGGKHIMLLGLKHGLKKGERIGGTLTFEHAGSVPVQFQVEAIGAAQASQGEAPSK